MEAKLSLQTKETDSLVMITKLINKHLGLHAGESLTRDSDLEGQEWGTGSKKGSFSAIHPEKHSWKSLGAQSCSQKIEPVPQIICGFSRTCSIHIHGRMEREFLLHLAQIRLW